MRVLIIFLIATIPLISHAEYVVHLVDGGKMYATAISQKGSRYVLKTQSGTMEIPKSRVERVENDVAVTKQYPGKPGYQAGYAAGTEEKKAPPQHKKLTPAEQQKLMVEINQKIEKKRQEIYATNRDTPENTRARKELEDYKRRLVIEYRAKGVELNYK